MTIDVLFFSTLRDLAGAGEIELELADDDCQTVASLLRRLYQNHPGLESWDDQLLIAVDQVYAARDTVLRDGQEVAIMPPVQGG